MTDVSVIIINWNTRQLLADCLDSLLRTADGLTLEYIVVDNGSTDGSQAMLCEQYPQVRLLANQENVGFGRANNQGMDVAQGRYALLFNSDALATPGFLQRMVALADANPKVGMVGAHLLNQDGMQFELAAAGVEALAQWELTRRVDERLREPTEAELEAFRQSQARRYRELEAIDLAVIQVLDTNARPDEDTKTRLERARAALVALGRGEVSFAEVATQLSLHPSGPAGGWLGWVPRRNVAHTFAGTAVEALRELEDGGHTGLLRFPSGTWILQRRGWRESREQSLAEAREAVAADFREHQIATLTAEVEEELLRAVQFEAQEGM